jgi:putative transposase
MAKYTSVFNQLLRYIPRSEFQAIVRRHGGDKGVRSFTCWKQFVALFYAQLTGQHTLRDLVTAVNASLHKLQHVGLTSVRRSTLADASSNRSHKIFRELFFTLYERCCKQAPSHGFQFRHKLYSLDATVIDLCLKVFDWAKFRQRKGAIKLHLMLDHEGQIPSFCVITPGREHEIQVARRQRYEPDSILTFDRGYLDYHWFDQLHRQEVFFVTRMKKNARYTVRERRRVDKSKGLTSDQTIWMTGSKAECLSTPLRRIGYRDPESKKHYVYLTNLFHLSAQEIAAIYKARWQIELFFKWVKQHLKIKSFLGTNANAVMTQVWVAFCVYLLIAYVKFLSKVPWSPYQIFKRLQVTALEYIDLGRVLAEKPKNARKGQHKWRQLNLLGRKVKPIFIVRYATSTEELPDCLAVSHL